MTTKKLQIFREVALPSVLEPYAIYLVAPSSSSDYVEFYVTNADGTAARRTPTTTDIQDLVNNAVAAVSSLLVVNDITERNALVLTTNALVLVADATGDSTVKSGAATYVFKADSSTWVKISEHESLDVSLTWDSIQGTPTSLVADIDDAVAKKHTHSNLTQLNKVGEDASGNFTYNGDLPYARYASTNW